MPIVNCSAWIGTSSSIGPRITTATASRANAAAVPMIAGRHPRTIETARMIVNA